MRVDREGASAMFTCVSRYLTSSLGKDVKKIKHRAKDRAKRATTCVCCAPAFAIQVSVAAQGSRGCKHLQSTEGVVDVAISLIKVLHMGMEDPPSTLIALLATASFREFQTRTGHQFSLHAPGLFGIKP